MVPENRHWDEEKREHEKLGSQRTNVEKQPAFWQGPACVPKNARFWRRWGFGPRTWKTALAVLICLLLDYLTGHGTPANACIAAVLTMQATERESYAVGARRILGTAIGGGVGLVMLGIHSLIPGDISRLLLVTLGVVLGISICCVIRNQEAAAFTAIVVLGITLDTSGGNIVALTLWQMGETMVGIAVAVMINRFIARPRLPQERQEAFEDEKSKGNPAQEGEW